MSGQWSRTRLFAVAVAAIGLVVGCSGKSNKPAPLHRIEVAAASASVAKGTSTALAATAVFADSSKQDVTGQVEWTSSDATVVAIENGRAKGMKEGSATVTAAFGGKTGSAGLTVTPAAPVSLTVTGPAGSVPKGAQAKVSASAVMTDGTAADVTHDATWSSDNPEIAALAEHGLVQAVDVGSARITAAMNGLTASTEVTVSAATLTQLEILPVGGKVPVGMTLAMHAKATYSDASVQEVTSLARWCSSKEQFATVSNDAGTEGLLTAIAEGTTSVCVNYCGVSVTTDVQVTAAIARSITIQPATLRLPKGDTFAFAAQAVFSDGSTRPVTAAAVWSSSEPGTASIDQKGLAKALAVGGPVTITAKVAGSDAEGTAQLTVTDAVLRTIQVSAAASSGAKGLPVQFGAVGLYSDEDHHDVTTKVTWTVEPSPDGAASISNADLSRGLMATDGVGAVKVTALDPSTQVTGWTVFTITDAVPRAIAIDPPAAAIPKGDTQRFKALVTFTDNELRDLSENPAIAWSSQSDPAGVASVSASGMAQGAQPGIATITAAILGTPLAASAQLTVKDAEIVSVHLTPAAKSLPKGLTYDFVATGRFTDGVDRTVTDAVTWTVSDEKVAGVVGGKVTALAIGETDVVAKGSTGTAGKARLIVTRQELRAVDPIVVTPPDAQRPSGLRQQFKATGWFTDGSDEDFTATVTWSAVDPATGDPSPLVSISNELGHGGDAVALAPGVAKIVAALPGTLTTGTAQLTVTPAVVARIDVYAFAYGTNPAPPASLPSMPLGRKASFDVWATYTDGQKLDLSGQAVCRAAPAGVLQSIDDSGLIGSEGGHPTAQGIAAGGVAKVTCALAGTPITGSASIGVTAKVLDRIVVSQGNGLLSIPRGLSVQFTATGVYSDQTSDPNLAGALEWSSETDALLFLPTDPRGMGYGANVKTTSVRATDPLTNIASDPLPFEVTDAQLISVQVYATDPKDAKDVPMGMTVQYRAEGTFTDGTYAVSPSWSVESKGGAATIDDGLATGTAMGEVLVRATLDGVPVAPGGQSSGTASLVVTDAVLVELVLSADEQNPVPKGEPVQFTAMGKMTYGIDRDYTKLVTWASSSSNVTIDTFGLAQTLADGSAPVTITATDPKTGKSKTIDLLVSPAKLVSIMVTANDEFGPTSVRLAAGLAQRFVATGTYTDKTRINLSDTVEWRSADTDWVTVIGSSDPKAGRAITSYHGYIPDEGHPVKITATHPEYPAVSAGEATIIVESPAVKDLEVQPIAPKDLALGLRQPLTAKAIYATYDNPSATLTLSAADGLTWRSSAPDVASVSRDGVVTAANQLPAGMAFPQSVTIRAEFRVVNGSCPAPEGCVFRKEVTVNVVAAILVEGNLSLKPDPANRSQPAGRSQRFTLTGTLSNGAPADLTDVASWAVDTANSIGTAILGARPGEFIGKGTGNVAITAKIPFNTRPEVDRDWIYADAFEVTAAVLDDVVIGTVDPATGQVVVPRTALPNGTARTYAALGIFTDGSEQIITDQCRWSSTSAVLTQIAASEFKATADPNTLPPWFGVVEAACEVNLVPKEKTFTQEISAALLDRIEISSPLATIAKGDSVQLVATGYYTDGTHQPITDQVDWTGGQGFVTVSNASPTKGQAAGTAEGGPVEITATEPITGKYATLSLSVGSHELETIAVLGPVDGATLPLGAVFLYSVDGRWSDGPGAPASCTWTPDPGNGGSAAVFTNANGTSAYVVATQAGRVAITVACGAEGGPVTVAVNASAVPIAAISFVNDRVISDAAIDLSAGRCMLATTYAAFSGMNDLFLTIADWRTDNAAAADVAVDPQSPWQAEVCAGSNAGDSTTIHATWSSIDPARPSALLHVTVVP